MVPSDALPTQSLRAAQLVELLQRSRVSVLMALPALVLVGAVHLGHVELTGIVAWLLPMLVIQVIRLAIARKYADHPSLGGGVDRLCRLECVLAGLSGIGWGLSLFALDTGRFDFQLLFKFAALASALGVSMNALSVVLRVYASFVAGTALTIVVYLAGFSPGLQAVERNSLIIGTLVYVAVVFFVGRHVSGLTRKSLGQRLEREEVLRRLDEAYRKEVSLRARLEADSRQMALLNEKLSELSRLDPLTGLANRRHLLEQFAKELNAAQRFGEAFSVVLFDIDDFKAINDQLGHQVGDQVLIGLARLVNAELRDIDSLGRWGGEEFICLLPRAGSDEALACAERLRTRLEAARLIAMLPTRAVTASFGVATWRPGDDADSLVSRADARLYVAKAAGKNQVVRERGEFAQQTLF